MALNRRVLEGREGDPALPWWREVWRWASSLPVVLGPGVTMTQVPGMGTEIKVRTAAAARIFFECSLSGTEVTVRPGMLAGQVPVILDRRFQPVPITGDAAGQVPTIDLSLSEPGPDGRSAIVIVARLDESGNLIDPREDPEAIEVKHVSDFGSIQKRGAAIARRPFHELAIIYWRDGRPDRVAQIVQHNLELAAAAPQGDRPAAERYFFYAAG